ncbi:MAG: tRNA lysidine(34) synthetase TilS [Thiomicrorhabdus sp.]|nr:tRNA lysidine(34) synthetase TilS [Thiomicrorhabdus sp.]
MPPVLTDESCIPESLGCFIRALEAFIAQSSRFTRITIAYSGGLDSTVLLHLLSLSPQLKNRLFAHYIDHGLQEKSTDWAEHCKVVCASLGIPFQASKLQWVSVKRQGIEAVARKLRYQALTKGCRLKTDILVTGHHQRDQAETVLLNLVRGSGVSGLSAMPVIKKIASPKGEATHIRPLLHIPYSAFQDYARHFKLAWIEDPSNQETRYRRNVIRQDVLPVLTNCWPEVEKTLARAAENMSEARALLERMAKKTLEELGFSKHYFDFEMLSKFDWLEQKNCLRYWFFNTFQLVLSTKHYDWIRGVLAQKSQSQNGAFSYQMKQGGVYFYQYRLYYLKQPLLPYCFHGLVNVTSDGQDTLQSWVLEREGEQFSLVQTSLLESNVYYEWEVATHLMERFSEFVIKSVSEEDVVNRKKLKAFFQKNKIPVWERKVWPVLVYDSVLVSVLGCTSCLKANVDLGIEGTKGGEKNPPPLVPIFISKVECYKLMGYSC